MPTTIPKNSTPKKTTAPKKAIGATGASKKILQILGEILLELRKARNMSMIQVSQAAGISSRAIVLLEQGGSGNLNSIYALSRVYQVIPSEMMKEAELRFLMREASGDPKSTAKPTPSCVN